MLRGRGLGLLAGLLEAGSPHLERAAASLAGDCSTSSSSANRLAAAAAGLQQWRGYSWAPQYIVHPRRSPAAAPVGLTAAALETGETTPKTRRSGLIAVKVGMTQEWDHWGARIPLTVLWVDECQVVQVKTEEREGYTAVQLGAGAKRPKQLKASLRGHFEAAGVPLKRKVVEFKVSPDALLPVGAELNAAHFVAGQFVDVTGTSIGKGFQGVMKRWGFKGQPASHGSSLAHRRPGSTGACQDPGKVFKGKKMPGRLGNERATVQNCVVWRVDPQRNLVYVRGQVPGNKGNWVMVRDSAKKTFEQQPARPCPTLLGERPPPSVAPQAGSDPFDYKD